MIEAPLPHLRMKVTKPRLLCVQHDHMYFECLELTRMGKKNVFHALEPVSELQL